MLLLTAPPESSMGAFYERMHREGAALSMPVHNVRFGVSDAFDPAWGVNSVCWLTGGAESYEFAGARRATLRSGGMLILSRRERYAYKTDCDFPFRTNMISFSDGIARSIGTSDCAEDLDAEGRAVGDRSADLSTRLATPTPAAAWMLASLVAACRNHEPERADEQAALLFAELLDDERRLRRATGALPAVKRSTRSELARRAALAADFMHQSYETATLTLEEIAQEARLSRYHFVRVFRALYGATPIEYLTVVRLDAAARLLAETPAPLGQVWRAAGFSDRTSFHRRFRGRFGVSPVRYRIERR